MHADLPPADARAGGQEGDDDGELPPPPSVARLVALAVVFTTLILLACAWRFTPLKDVIDVGSLARMSERFAGTPLLPLVVLLAYLVGAVLVIPLTVLIAVTGLVFGPLAGGLYALACATLSSVVFYLLGRALGRDTLRAIAGRRIVGISKRLSHRGVTTVALVRLLPIAPFTLVNLVAGASHIRLSDFTLGTVAGLAPGIVLIVLFVDRLVDVVLHPGWASIAIVVVIAGLAIGVALALRRRPSR